MDGRPSGDADPVPQLVERARRPSPRCRRSTGRLARLLDGELPLDAARRRRPAQPAEADDRPGPHAADEPEAVRAYLGDGNFGGYYERPDEDMLAIWEVAVDGDARAARRRLGDERAADPRSGAPARSAARLGAAFVRAGHDVLFVDRDADHVAAINDARPGDHRADRPGSRARARPSLPEERRRHASSASSCASRRRTRRPPPRRCCRISPTDGYVVSAQNGLNELVIAEIVGERAHDRLLRQFRRRLHGARAWSSTAATARWWSASSTAAMTPRIERPARAAARVRAERRADRQHLGLSLGQADLRRAAVRHRAHRRLASPTCLADARYRPVLSRAGARGGRGGRGRAASGSRPSTASTRTPSPPGALDGRDRRAPSTTWSPTTAARPSRTAASGAISPSASARPRSTRSSCRSCAIGRSVTVWRSPLTARLVELIHEIEEGRRPLALANAASDAGCEAHGAHEHRLRRPHRHRHRRRAWLRPRHRPRLRRPRAPRSAPATSAADGLAETARPRAATCHVANGRCQRPRPRSQAAGRAKPGGAIDILVNNAGGVRGQVGRPLEEVSEADWQRDLRRQSHRRLLLRAGGGARHEARGATAGSSTSRAAPGSASA